MPRTGRPIRGLAPLILSGALSACLPAPAPQAPPVPPAPAAPAAPAQPAVSAESAALRRELARVQAELLSRGLLRTDGGAADAPWTAGQLAETFLRLALYDEYAQTGAGLVARQTASHLRRWEDPVRVAVRFGASVPPDRQAADRARLASYLDRLAGVTGHPIALVETGANFVVHIVNEDERRALAPEVNRHLPGLTPSQVAGITDMPRNTYCLVYALSAGNSGRYTRAMAVIRAEHPDLMRLGCLHEEIAQGLGLANDSPTARPSIFNDDEEFALLTPMDEMMLHMLYSPRLRPGMTEAEARPIVHALARSLMGEGS